MIRIIVKPSGKTEMLGLFSPHPENSWLLDFKSFLTAYNCFTVSFLNDILFIFTLLYLCGHLTLPSIAPLTLFLFCCGLGLQRTKVIRNVWKVLVDLIQSQCIRVGGSHGSALDHPEDFSSYKYAGPIPGDSNSGDFHLY